MVRLFEFLGSKPERDELKTLAQEPSCLTEREEKQMPGKSSCHLGYFTSQTSSAAAESNYNFMTRTPVDYDSELCRENIQITILKLIKCMVALSFRVSDMF